MTYLVVLTFIDMSGYLNVLSSYTMGRFTTSTLIVNSCMILLLQLRESVTFRVELPMCFARIGSNLKLLVSISYASKPVD